MAAKVPQFKLNNGVLMPSVGLGELQPLGPCLSVLAEANIVVQAAGWASQAVARGSTTWSPRQLKLGTATLTRLMGESQTSTVAEGLVLVMAVTNLIAGTRMRSMWARLSGTAACLARSEWS